MKLIKYNTLNNKQKETFNFQKVSAILADYGYATIKINDDWQGADFIAQHIDGNEFLKVQLKGRLTFEKKYLNKKIFICFPYKNDWYLFDHDELLSVFLERYKTKMATSKSWKDSGGYSWNKISAEQKILLSKYKI